MLLLMAQYISEIKLVLPEASGLLTILLWVRDVSSCDGQLRRAAAMEVVEISLMPRLAIDLSGRCNVTDHERNFMF